MPVDLLLMRVPEEVDEPSEMEGDLEVLGSLEEVRGHLRHAFPAIELLGEEARVGGPGWSVIFDLGEDPVVGLPTRMIGGPSAIVAVRKLATNCGWQMLHPESGSILEPEGDAAEAWVALGGDDAGADQRHEDSTWHGTA